MKRIVLMMLVAAVLVSLTACNTEYPFPKQYNDIQKIEIIKIINDEQITIKTLSDKEKDEFIIKFKEIDFKSYWFGDPMRVSGTAIKITYNNTTYDVISYYWSERFIQSEKYFIRRYCNEESYNNLLSEYLG